MMASAGRGQPSVPPSSATIGVMETFDDKRVRRSRPVTRSVSQRSASVGVMEVLDDKSVRRSRPVTRSVSQRSASVGVMQVLDDERVRRSRPVTRSVSQGAATVGVVKVLDNKRVRRSSPFTRSVPRPPATIGVVEVLDHKRVRRRSPITPSVPRPPATIGVMDVLDDKRVQRGSPTTMGDYAEGVLHQRAVAASRAPSVRSVVDVNSFVAGVDVRVVEDRKEKGIREYGRKAWPGSLTPSIIERSGSSSTRTPASRLPPLPTALCAVAASMAPSVRSVVDVNSIVGGVDVRVVEDRKGKGIREYGRKAWPGSLTPSIIERSGSSSTRTPASRLPPLPTALCAICMEDKLLSQCCSMKGCAHLFCRDCVSQYVAAKVQENVTAIKCPQPDCKGGSLEPEICRPFLPVRVFDRWCTALCEALFLGHMRFYCPFKDCSALLIDEPASGSGGGKVDVITHSECPHCHRLFCAQCKVPWHAGVTCDVFQSLGADERKREDIMLMEMAKKSKWQRCPKCKFFVERTGGCMFMQCRCGFRFCYGCASPMLIDHYCTKCGR